VSDIAQNPHHVRLTVYSYDEGRALASLAADYIRISGTADQIFIDYFGRESSPLPFDIFTVCPESPDGNPFLIALLFRQWPWMKTDRPT
jgi:hypothetical protein